MSRSDLAKRLKTTRLRVWRIETDKTRLPADELPQWARALKTTIAELLA